MQTDYIEILNNFDLNNLPNLDVVVRGALQLFKQTELPRIDTSRYRRPLVVGSGNAEVAGRIAFSKLDAVFASESDCEEKLSNISGIDGVILISASGKKNAPIIAEMARRFNKHLTLITNSANSPAKAIFDDAPEMFNEYVFPKNREPYTYNTSTYMGLILGSTGENPVEIEDFINNVIDKIELPDFSKYNKYYLAVPTNLSNITRMLNVKFIELFGRNIARDVETAEYLMRHATTVVPSDELFISFGVENGVWGSPENRLYVPLPENCGYGAMMAIGYYVVSKIQAAYPNYFKDNIESYTEKVSSIIGQSILPIVD